MTATTPTFEREWLALGSGQTGLHWLAAGTTLVALEGTLRLEPPSRWGAGVRYTLGAGHAHVVETSGWWHLHADADRLVLQRRDARERLLVQGERLGAEAALHLPLEAVGVGPDARERRRDVDRRE